MSQPKEGATLRTGGESPSTAHFCALSVPDDAGDQLLYHYTDAEAALDGILTNGTLRLNPYGAMRDPLENKQLARMVAFSGPDRPNRLPLRKAQQLLDDIRGQVRILSLTMDEAGYGDGPLSVFGRGYARPRLWEQYGDTHRGVCLAFSANCLTGEFVEAMKRLGAYNIANVDYTAAGFVASKGRALDGSRLTDSTAARILTQHLIDHNEDFFFLKLLDWETEFELRFALFNAEVPPDEPIDVPFGSCLRAIILGELFSPNLTPKAAGLAARFGVPAGRLDWTSGVPSFVRLGS